MVLVHDGNQEQLRYVRIDPDGLQTEDGVLAEGEERKANPRLSKLDTGVGLVWVEDDRNLLYQHLDDDATPLRTPQQLKETVYQGYLPLALSPVEVEGRFVGTTLATADRPSDRNQISVSLVSQGGDLLCTSN